jgi:hypothetical protein
VYLRMLGTSVDSLAGGTGETVRYVPLSYLLISQTVADSARIKFTRT